MSDGPTITLIWMDIILMLLLILRLNKRVDKIERKMDERTRS